jgi:hypothetical protein
MCWMRVSSASRRSVGASGVPSARTAPCAISVKSVSLRSANTSLRCAAARGSSSTVAASICHCSSV